MGLIELESIKIYARHGCLPEERAIGSEYHVDVKIKTKMTKAMASDALADAVDYVTVCQIVTEEMGIPSNLLEHVAKRIIDRLSALDLVAKAQVSVTKINPPIGADIKGVKVTVRKKNAVAKNAV